MSSEFFEKPVFFRPPKSSFQLLGGIGKRVYRIDSPCLSRSYRQKSVSESFPMSSAQVYIQEADYLDQAVSPRENERYF